MRGSTTRRRADEDESGGDGEVEASATGGAEGSDDAGEPTEVEVEEEESDAKEAEREPSEDEETSEEIEQREREEQSAARAVSRRVFGGEADDRAIVVTRSLFAFGAFCIACAFVPKVVGLLCSYFEPLDTAVTAFEALTSNVGLDLRIMRATSTATFKVVALCVVITGLMREGKLPLETPVVVSKLAFNVMLPAYLCTRVAATLYLSPLTKALAVLPMSAMAQVIFGAFIGVGVTAIVNKIFAYTAAAHKEDMEDEELLEVEQKERDMSRLGIAACSFGNTFTLPLVFLTEVLGRARADETAGYIALYLIGWTPVLWTVGFLLIAGPVAVAGLSKSGEKKDAMRDAYLTARATMVRISKELLNPPLLGIIAGVLIGATPLKEIFVGNFTEATTDFPMLLSFISVVFRSLFELAASIGAAALPGQMLVLASSLVKITPEDVEKRIARAKKEKMRAATNREDDDNDDDDAEASPSLPASSSSSSSFHSSSAIDEEEAARISAELVALRAELAGVRGFSGVSSGLRSPGPGGSGDLGQVVGEASTVEEASDPVDWATLAKSRALWSPGLDGDDTAGDDAEAARGDSPGTAARGGFGETAGAAASETAERVRLLEEDAAWRRRLGMTENAQDDQPLGH